MLPMLRERCCIISMSSSGMMICLIFWIFPRKSFRKYDSSEVYGTTKTTIFAHEVPIAGIAGDQQSAMFGQMCQEPGMLKNTYGTGSFIMFNTGDEPILSENNLLSTIGWRRNSETTYALEGSIFIAGAVVQ